MNERKERIERKERKKERKKFKKREKGVLCSSPTLPSREVSEVRPKRFFDFAKNCLSCSSR